jgi:hypothetical protein
MGLLVDYCMTFTRWFEGWWVIEVRGGTNPYKGLSSSNSAAGIWSRSNCAQVFSCLATFFQWLLGFFQSPPLCEFCSWWLCAMGLDDSIVLPTVYFALEHGVEMVLFTWFHCQSFATTMCLQCTRESVP